MRIHQDNSTSTSTIYKQRKYLTPQVSDLLPRDQIQSLRLHEPKFRRPLMDPMTGEGIKIRKNQPKLVDGNLTLYFVSNENLKAYLDLPLNHPIVVLPYPADENSDRGG